MVTPVIVANNFIKRALTTRKDLSPMKLQKMIYFLYRAYLKETNERLFTEPFEAWQYGPVLRSVYDEFRPFGAKSINRFAKDSAGDVYTVQETGPFKECIDRIWNQYAGWTAWEMSMSTHAPGGAWDKACHSDYYLKDEDIIHEQS